MVTPRTLLLASASPRRREILETLGFGFDVAAVDADERVLASEAPGAYLERVVAEKLRLARALAAARGRAAVMVADTIVVRDGAILGKPVDEAENGAMLRSLSGRTHEVMTRFAVAVVRPTADVAGDGDVAMLARTVSTRVTFRALSDDEVRGYVETGEGRDKAGGYAIQGLGAFAVSGIEGSYTNVVGLPACEVVQALLTLGFIEGFPPRGA